MSAGDWRCFVALPIGENLRRDLALAVDRWRTLPACEAMRWTPPEAWHVTLAFLGSVAPERVPAIIGALTDAVAEVDLPPRLPTGGVGAFPSSARARVAWYGVGDKAGELGRLADGVRRRLGVPSADGPFRPHITLARQRSARGDDLREWVRVAGPPAGHLDLRTIHLMRSHLGRGPARYESLAEISLTRNVASAAHA